MALVSVLVAGALFSVGVYLLGVRTGKQVEYTRVSEGFESKKVKPQRSKTAKLFIVGLVLMFTGMTVFALGVMPSIAGGGYPLPIRGIGLIQGDVYPYQIVDGKLLFGQVKDGEVVCRLANWESFHPSERSKIVLPGLKSYTFINTPHGIEVKEKEEAPEQ